MEIQKWGKNTLGTSGASRFTTHIIKNIDYSQFKWCFLCCILMSTVNPVYFLLLVAALTPPFLHRDHLGFLSSCLAADHWRPALLWPGRSRSMRLMEDGRAKTASQTAGRQHRWFMMGRNTSSQGRAKPRSFTLCKRKMIPLTTKPLCRGGGQCLTCCCMHMCLLCWLQASCSHEAVQEGTSVSQECGQTASLSRCDYSYGNKHYRHTHTPFFRSIHTCFTLQAVLILISEDWWCSPWFVQQLVANSH